MRFFLLWIAIGAVLALSGCKSDGGAKSTATSPIPSASAIVGDLLTAASDLTGCKLDIEGSQYVNYYSRSFSCDDGIRLTNDVGFLASLDDARTWQSNNWGTRDAANDIIKPALATRPIDPNSVKVEDLSKTAPKLGADDENLYCSSYSDPSGAQRVSQYWGAYRYKASVVQYSASAVDGGACALGSRTHEAARTLATTQLVKLKTKLP